MKRLALGLLVLLLAFSPARAPAQAIGSGTTILCNKFQPFTGAGSLTSVIAGAVGQTIAVCGWHITNTAATGNFDINTGTGTNCGTGTVDVTGVLSVTNTASSSDHIDFAMFSPVVGGSVCVNATVTTVTGVLWYATSQ